MIRYWQNLIIWYNWDKKEGELIASYLSHEELDKVEKFLKTIKAVLATKEVVFERSEKNKKFDRLYNISNDEKIEIIKSLTKDDCVKIGSNDNLNYPEAEVYVFIKAVDVYFFGEEEKIKMYIKMYLLELKEYDEVVVISFHEEGLYDWILYTKNRRKETLSWKK